MGRCRTHDPSEWVGFDRFEGVNPAVDQAIMGFAVVVDLVYANLIVVEPHLVVSVG